MNDDEFKRLVDHFAELIARKVVEVQRAEAEKNRVRYLTPEQMAERLNLSTKTLANLRSAKRGPKFTRVGRVIRYVVTTDAGEAHGDTTH